MKLYPSQFTERNELNLRHGIKSSLAEIKELFALTFALYLANDKKALLNYSKEENTPNEKIVISDKLFSQLEIFFGNLVANKSDFKNKINENPLFKAQIEALQVSLELFWKLGKVDFVKSHASSHERTGGKRFNKKISFSCNIILLENILSESDGAISPTLKHLLYNWIIQTNNFVANEILFAKIRSTLTIFSEETQFKMRQSNNVELYFQQEGIYTQLTQDNTVEDKDSNEPVGTFRILKSFIKTELHNFIREDGANGFTIKSGRNKEELKEYLEMVKTSLNLIPKRTVIYEEQISDKPNIQKNLPFPTQNRIFFGCPGTGKSYKVNEITKEYSKRQWERVTFHPEYDYSSFVGTFKPTSSKDDTGKDIIKYEFVPQVFTEIYVKAWKDEENPYFLLIEEINRGNCAEIFGDIFQLLDRNANYEVAPSQELKKYLVRELGENHEGISNGLKLPPNLSLLATMNTSDQSLFPMDSAFKRRWEWQYVPIDYSDAENQAIEISEKTGEKRTYSWASFLKVINEKIYNITECEDKQMGNRFVNMPEIEGKRIITEEVLKNKIMFYLWFDVFKNEDSKDKTNYIFRKSATETFKYADLFDRETGTETLLAFFAYNQIMEK